MNPQELSEQEQEKAKKEIAKALGIDENFNVDCNRAMGFFLIDNPTRKEKGKTIHEGGRLKIKYFDLALLTKYPLMFSQCDFECNVRSIFFPTYNTYCSLRFFDCIFEESVSLGLSNFQAFSYQIEKCVFKDSVKIQGTFDKSAYFTNNTFKANVDFSEAVFEKQASFYGSTFEQCPNFAQCRFGGELNLVNTNLSFDFENTQNQISLAWKNVQNHFIASRSIDYVANDFRDSFRLFKNALSKEGNLLDASNYHRVELYCKEIELDSKPNKKLQDKIDKWQLWFYRNTSDHHTDLLKIVIWLLSVMALFGVLLFAHRYEVDFDKFSHTHSTHPLIKPLISHISQWITQTKFLGLAYVLLVCGIIFKKTRGLISLSVVFAIISIQPKYILGVAGLMSENIQIQGMFENLLFVFYSFFITLFLFSLQKTARKNSIVPS